MAPKRWARPNGKNGAGENAYATGALLQYICGEILSNNCLGLQEEEMAGMARELINSKTRAEVVEWSKTLMLTDAFAAEVTRRREQYGPAFDGESVPDAPPMSLAPVAAAAAAPAATAGTLNVGKRGAAATKRGRRAVNINELAKSTAATEALKPGRFECGCFATVHNLRGSCANCGRIICEQEADEVCYACGMETARCIAYEISVQDGKLSEAAQERNQADYATAVERRDRLLEYAQNRARRTTVIDDQSATLFAPQSAWMTQAERRAAAKSTAEEERRRHVELMHRQRGAYQVHMNFISENLPLGARKENAGGAAAEADAGAATAEDAEADVVADVVVGPTGAEPLPSLLQRIWYSPDGTRVDAAPGVKKGVSVRAGGGGGGADADLPTQDGTSMPLTTRPTQRRFDEVSRRVQQAYFEDDVEVFAEETAETAQAQLMVVPPVQLETEQEAAAAADGGASASPPLSSSPAAALSSRFAVTTVMRNTDDGVCLSMHQPWASLLVAGIKRHEGRVWGTTFRGRLWIHAAAAQVTNAEEVEAHYAPFAPPDHVFPKHYPTKVLLGYVYVTDCLDRDAYEAAFKPEERQEESPYSFVCAEPKALLFPLPMNGNHKLFTLDHRVHVAARKQLGEVS
ncbi:putative zinc finger motif, C2HC5-type/ASCH domain containing protein [Novymonas esmeraldas]|uniref:Zinc finger motif, C2HC5-type/ASCH domain containing protein n=1 Tax=Novymonas esmeraldas TaxID=1808958 RepID=A0AAW0FAD7_9TRYP